MAQAFFDLKSVDPAERGKCINTAIRDEFWRRRDGNLKGDTFTRKKLRYKSDSGDTIVEAYGRFKETKSTSLWGESKTIPSGYVQKIKYTYIDPLTGGKSKVHYKGFRIGFEEIGGVGLGFAGKIFGGDDTFVLKGSLGVKNDDRSGSSISRPSIFCSFNMYEGDDVVKISGGLSVTVSGGPGKDKFVNILPRKSSSFAQLTLFDAEPGEILELAGSQSDWTKVSGSIYKGDYSDISNDNRLFVVVGTSLEDLRIEG